MPKGKNDTVNDGAQQPIPQDLSHAEKLDLLLKKARGLELDKSAKPKKSPQELLNNLLKSQRVHDDSAKPETPKKRRANTPRPAKGFKVSSPSLRKSVRKPSVVDPIDTIKKRVLNSANAWLAQAEDIHDVYKLYEILNRLGKSEISSAEALQMTPPTPYAPEAFEVVQVSHDNTPPSTPLYANRPTIGISTDTPAGYGYQPTQLETDPAKIRSEHEAEMTGLKNWCFALIQEYQQRNIGLVDDIKVLRAAIKKVNPNFKSPSRKVRVIKTSTESIDILGKTDEELMEIQEKLQKGYSDLLSTIADLRIQADEREDLLKKENNELKKRVKELGDQQQVETSSEGEEEYFSLLETNLSGIVQPSTVQEALSGMPTPPSSPLKSQPPTPKRSIRELTNSPYLEQHDSELKAREAELEKNHS